MQRASDILALDALDIFGGLLSRNPLRLSTEQYWNEKKGIAESELDKLHNALSRTFDTIGNLDTLPSAIAKASRELAQAETEHVSEREYLALKHRLESLQRTYRGILSLSQWPGPLAGSAGLILCAPYWSKNLRDFAHYAIDWETSQVNHAIAQRKFDCFDAVTITRQAEELRRKAAMRLVSAGMNMRDKEHASKTNPVKKRAKLKPLAAL